MKLTKPLDTRKIADLATTIESLKAEIARKEAELARLCGLPAPAEAEPKVRKPRRGRNIEVAGLGLTAPVGSAQTEAQQPQNTTARDPEFDNPHHGHDMPGHDPDRTPPPDGLSEIPYFLRKGGTMTDAEKLAQAERVLDDGGKP